MNYKFVQGQAMTNRFRYNVVTIAERKGIKLSNGGDGWAYRGLYKVLVQGGDVTLSYIESVAKTLRVQPLALLKKIPELITQYHH